MGTVTRGDQKSGLHVNVNKSFMPLEAVPVQKGTHPAAHNEAWRSTSDTRDIKETCGAGHAKLQMFVPNALFLIAQQRGGQMALILLPDPHEGWNGIYGVHATVKNTASYGAAPVGISSHPQSEPPELPDLAYEFYQVSAKNCPQALQDSKRSQFTSSCQTSAVMTLCMRRALSTPVSPVSLAMLVTIQSYGVTSNTLPSGSNEPKSPRKNIQMSNILCVERLVWFGLLKDESGLSEAELESLRKAQDWLEQMRQLKETEDQVSAAKRNILQAVTLALEEHGVQEEKREGVDEAGAETLLGTFTYDVNKMVAQTFHVQRQLPKTFRYIKFQVESNWGNPEYTCVYRVQDESGLSEAELESLRKAQGWLEQMRQLKETEDQVSAAKRNILQAVTLALEEHGVQEEKREGVDEAGAETLLGTFTYDVNKMVAQTFHVQRQLPKTFRYIKFQVESNWGNPEYTCVYRVQIGNLHHCSELFDAVWYFKFQVERDWGNPEYTCVYRVQEYRKRDESGLSEAELESLRKAQGWLEQMRQLKETEDQVSAAKRNILQAVTLALEEHGVQEEKREGVDEAGAETLLGTFTYDVNKMVAQTFHVQRQLPKTFRYIKFQVESNWGNPEYTCVYRVQIGNLHHCSELFDAVWYFKFQVERDRGNPEYTCVYRVQEYRKRDESGLSEAELESLRKAQGWLEQMRQLKETEDQVSAAKRNILQAVTLALEEHGVQEEKREGVDEAGAETLLGTFTYDVNKMIAQTFHVQRQLPKTFRYIKFQVESNWGNPEYTCVYRVQIGNLHHCSELFDAVWYFKFQVERDRGNPEYTCVYRVQEYRKRDESGLSEAELESLRKAQGWLEQMRQLKETEDQVSAAKRNILQAVTLALEEHGVQEEKREGVDEAGAETLLGTFTYDVNKMIAQTFHVQRQLPKTFRYIKFQVESNWGNPEYTCVYRVQIGNLHHCSELFDAVWYFKFQVERDRGNPEYTCVYRVQEYRKRDESGLSEAELESLRKAQGWLEQMRQLKETEDQVSAAKRNILQAVTLALEEHGVQEEKREGVDEAGAETLLGTFTYDVNKMIAQTFHVQRQLPKTFRYIKFQVESNWGNPEYTCVYRVQIGNLHHCSELFDAVWYFKFQVERDRGNPEYTCVYRVQEYRKRDESGLSEAELESLRKAQGWLEQMRQLKETEDQVSAAKRNILQAVTLALEEHGVQEEKREGVDEAGAETLLGTFTYDVNKMIAQTFHVQRQLPKTFRYIKFQVESNWGNPEYTCVYRVQIGNLHHCSELFDAVWYFKFQVERDRGNPEYTCVYRVQEYRKRDESGLSEAELESLRKAQGWLEQMRQLKETEDQVSAAKRNILQAVTLALEEHGVQEEKREGVDEAGAETLLGTFTYDVNKMIAQTFHVQRQLPKTFRYIKFQVESNWGNPEYTCVYRVQIGNLHHCSELFDAVWYFKFQVERDRGNPEYTCVYRVQEYRKRDESGLSEAELESLRKAQGWLEQMRQLKETEDQVSAAKRNILQAVTLALEEHGVQEEKREGVDEAGAETLLGTFTYDVNKMVAQTFHVQRQLPKTFRYIKFQVESNWGNPEYTCVYRVQIGNLHHCSELFDAVWYFKFQVERDRGNPEYTCVYRVQEYRKRDESGLSEAELESLRKAQGWLEQMRQLKETEDQVSAAKRNILQAVTLALEEHGVQEEKREGVDEAGAETLLGTFTYDVNKMIAQTFHVQRQLPKTFRYIKFQVESNWGNPEYTCVYRVQIGNLHHCSELFDAVWYFKFQVERDRGNPEYTCVYRVQEYRKRDESGLSEAELESLRKAQGWLEQMRQLKETEDQVSAAKRNILQAVTLALEEHGVQEEKREGVDEAGAETLLGTFTYDVNKMIAQTFHVQRQLPKTFRYIKFQVESNWGNPEYTCVYRVQIGNLHHCSELFDAVWYFKFQVERDRGNPEYTCVYRVQEYRKRDESGLSEAELESLRKAQGWLEQMRQLKETEDQVSAAKRNILQAVTLALEEHGVQEEKREGVDEAGAETLLGTFTYDVNKMVAQTFHVQRQLPKTFRYIKFQVESNWGNPEYTCVYRVQIGNLHHCSELFDAVWYFKFQVERDRGNPEYTCVYRVQEYRKRDESGLSEAELESLRKAQGWLEQMRQLKETEDQVSAAKRNILQAVTLALEEHGVQEEKREGVDEAGAETLLGTFTYDVNKMIAQTFHVQRQLPKTFRYIKFQVESNWGNPEYTCVYRVQIGNLHHCSELFDAVWYFKFQVERDRGNPEYTCVYRVQEYRKRDESGLSEAELESLRKAQGWLEQMRQLKETEDQVSAAKRNILQAVTLALEEHGVQEEKREGVDEAGAETLLGTFTYDVNKMIAQTFHVQRQLPKTFRYIKFQVESNWGNPEYTCVYRVQDESGLSEAELESLRKAQGWLEQMRQLKETEDQVSAAKRNILQAVTLALEEHGVQEEKREGVDEAGAETLLGTFTYDVNKMIAQTFHVQRQLPKTFRYIKFQVESNWGNPEYTCVYRVQIGNLHHCSELFDAVWYFKFQVERDRGNPEYTCVYRVQEYRKRDESGLSEAELESLRKAQGWLEQMRQLKETEDQVSAAKRNILQAVTLALEEHGVQEEKREDFLIRCDTSLIFAFFFCESNEVGQDYCDIPLMLALSCSTNYRKELVILIVAGVQYLCGHSDLIYLYPLGCPEHELFREQVSICMGLFSCLHKLLLVEMILCNGMLQRPLSKTASSGIIPLYHQQMQQLRLQHVRDEPLQKWKLVVYD
ncbi:hypothetical protein Q9966_014394 [Columba livia]|nr:hypothetical protein Q9966_014394 [Columba livia]